MNGMEFVCGGVVDNVPKMYIVVEPTIPDVVTLIEPSEALTDIKVVIVDALSLVIFVESYPSYVSLREVDPQLVLKE